MVSKKLKKIKQSCKNYLKELYRKFKYALGYGKFQLARRKFVRNKIICWRANYCEGGQIYFYNNDESIIKHINQDYQKQFLSKIQKQGFENGFWLTWQLYIKYLNGQTYHYGINAIDMQITNKLGKIENRKFTMPIKKEATETKIKSNDKIEKQQQAKDRIEEIKKNPEEAKRQAKLKPKPKKNRKKNKFVDKRNEYTTSNPFDF